MNAREVIAKAMAEYWDRPEQAECYEVQAEDALTALSTAGFTIMSKEDVERIERAILDDREGKVSAATVLHMIKDAMQR